ncbi:hypothetical protein DM619_19820 [Escherichia coli]|nr:hypothetical protein [Escherichia coli]RBJ24448.1 hypothetical protein DSB62_18625 [Escherichia coli]
MIVANNHLAGQGLPLLMMDFSINNFFHIKLQLVISYKSFKREDGYMRYFSVPKALPSFLCGLLTVYRTLLLMLIDIYFYLIHSIIIF